MENYTCSACNAKFNSKQELDEHAQRDHKQQKAGAEATEGQKR